MTTAIGQGIGPTARASFADYVLADDNALRCSMLIVGTSARRHVGEPGVDPF